MKDSNSPELRDLLRAELAAEEERAPDFDAVWSSASARHHRERTRSILTRIGAVAAAAALIAAGWLALRSPRPAEPAPVLAVTDVPWRSAVLLTDWRTPTDALLPTTELFSLQP